MKTEAVILTAVDDVGRATLIRSNLQRAGLVNEMRHFRNRRETLDFLFSRGNGSRRLPGVPSILLLDIRMPQVDGVEVLRRIKEDGELRALPVIMITTTDDPREVERCHRIGSSNYIGMPVEDDAFVNAIRSLGLFLSVVESPGIPGETGG